MAIALTPDQAASFNRRLATYGVSLDDLKGRDHHTGRAVAARAAAAGPPTLVFGHPDGGADVAGEVRRVETIAAMKVLGGVPDYHFTEEGVSDAHVDYPPPPKPEALAAAGAHGGDLCKLLDAVPPDTAGDAQRAVKAYLLGSSAKVKDWEPLLDAMFFPQDGTVINAGDVVVAAGSVLKISGPGPVVYNAASVTVEPGGSIVCTTDVTFNVGSFDVQA